MSVHTIARRAVALLEYDAHAQLLGYKEHKRMPWRNDDDTTVRCQCGWQVWIPPAQ